MTTTTVYVGMDAWINQAAPAQVNNETRGLKIDPDTGSQKQAFLWFKLPFTPGADVDVSEAILTFNTRNLGAGSYSVVVRRITSSWAARSINWDNAPTVSSFTTTLPTVADGENSVDITNKISAVADGDIPWYGVRLSGGGDPLAIWSREALDPTKRPRLQVTWTEKPDAPVDLSPSGGRAVSASKPNLGWHNPGFRGETTQAMAQVQMADDISPVNVVFDSGMIALTETEIDLSDVTYGAPAISNGDTRWWRVKYQDDQGRESAYSDWAEFERHTLGTLTLTHPTDGAVLKDLTPQVTATLSGATLRTWALFLERLSDGAWEEVWRRPRTVTNDLSVSVPAGVIRRTDLDYRFRARAWDDKDREWRPDDPPFSQDIANFTFDESVIPAPVATIVVTQHADSSPIVDVTVTTADEPDYFSLVVDGDHKYPRIDPDDVHVSGNTYRILYTDASPGVELTYKVQRVEIISGELLHSFGNPTATYASQPFGIWLFDPDEITDDVRLEGPQHGADFAWGEVANTFFPSGSRWPQPPVRLLQSTRGREGTVNGAVRDVGSVTAADYLRRIRRIWRQGKVMRLVIGELNIPVMIGEPHDSPLNERPSGYQVEFAVWQVDDFDR